MSRRAIKAINWAALAERVPESEKSALSAFKSRSDQYFQRMMANPESLPKIDWTYYKSNITIPGLVDKFQREYETLSIPYPEDKYSAQIEEEKKEMTKKVEIFIRELDAKIEQTQKEIEKTKNMLPFAAMTMEDFVTTYPDGPLGVNNKTIWPHTADTQEKFDEEDDIDEEDDH